MTYGYARVSTKGQAMHGNSLMEQRDRLVEAGCIEVYSDSYTGTKMERPEFDAMLEKLKEGDTVVVTKLDRFARTAADGAKLIQKLVNDGINVHVLNMGRADNTPMGKLMITILLAFAEFERDMIVERTTTGKDKKRELDPNWREGRKPVDIPDFEKFLKKQKEGLMTVAECCAELKISRSTWNRRARQT